ncbi:MAG: hypothetical protein ABJC09_17400 [Terriglobia bacterium]
MPFIQQVPQMLYRNLCPIGMASVFSFFLLTGCNRAAEPAAQNYAVDPANGNLASVPAPVQSQAEPAQYPAEPAQYGGPQQSPAPSPPASYRQGDPNAAAVDYAAYDDQIVEAPQPPPPLPEYGQPQVPGDNYIWTPGFWSYGSGGYFWVPGAWVVAPFVSALWTPPYWENLGNRYRWHRGYWGEHVGFYGGINYGFGYTGRGYSGGYWSGDTFNYNRAVNNVNPSRIHNAYNYNVQNYTSPNRVSYYGSGGVEVRPTAPELAVRNERRVPPIPAQLPQMRQAAESRAQLASVNQGRPQIVVATAPLATPYRVPAARLTPQPPSAPTPQVSGRAGIENPPPVNRPEVRPQDHSSRADRGTALAPQAPAPPPIAPPAIATQKGPQRNRPIPAPAAAPPPVQHLERAQREAVPPVASQPQRTPGPPATPPFFSHRDAAPAPPQPPISQERPSHIDRGQRGFAQAAPPPAVPQANPPSSPPQRSRPQEQAAPARPQPQMRGVETPRAAVAPATAPQGRPEMHPPAVHPEGNPHKDRAQ